MKFWEILVIYPKSKSYLKNQIVDYPQNPNPNLVACGINASSKMANGQDDIDVSDFEFVNTVNS